MMKLLKKLRNSKRGFSLVELIVVIAIMAVIAVILIPSLLRYVEDSRAEKDVKTTDELVTAVELALADQDIYDELVEHSVWDNVSCYVDKDSESGFNKVVIKETYNGNAEQYKFDDDARQNDEVPYYGAGNMRGLTITLSPTKDSNESTYELSRAIINRFVGRKTGYLYECEKLYNNVRSIVGDTIQNSSQTYRNSDFTIFIRLGSAGGNEAGNQDATQVWGQYNGTNLPADTVQTAKITTDRVIGDAGQYDKDVNDYINDEANTDIDFSKLAQMGGSNFGSTLDKEETLGAGLYDENDNLIVSWEDSGIDETCSNAKTKLNDYPNTRKIIMGNSVTSVAGIAFMSCANLTNVTIPNSVTSIGTLAFNNCKSLKSINIPNSVTSIGKGAFVGCKSLASINIPNSVTSINMTFKDCSSLTSIVIPASVTSIGYSTFMGCANLQSITVDKNNPVYDSRENCNAIIETSTNVLITGCSNTIIPNTVTSIGPEAFDGNLILTNITIPNSVTSIDRSVFSQCKNLTNATIPNSVTSINKFAFLDCENLETINYTGTISEWENINFLNSNWNQGCPQFTVHCTDGDIVIPTY